MIKLIASDVDGTLLPGGGQHLHERTIAMIQKCRACGVPFVAASGRQYPNMERLFAPVREDVIYAAENGALDVAGGEILRQKAIDRQTGLRLLESIRETAGCAPMLSGRYTSYLPAGNTYMLDRVANHFGNTVTTIANMALVTEPFLKISAFVRDRDVQQKATHFKELWGDTFSVMVAGEEWVDFALEGKEGALLMLMEHFHLTADEMIVFGDNYNDEGMMRLAGHAYAMKGAAAELSALCGNTCHSVEDIIMPLLDTVDLR